MFQIQHLLTELTPTEIYKRVSDKDLWIKYLGFFTLNFSFKHPLRKDNNPSASLFKSDASGRHYLHDFAKGTNIGIFDYIKEKVLKEEGIALTFRQVLEKVNKDFNLNIGTPLQTEENEINVVITKQLPSKPYDPYKSNIELLPNFHKFSEAGLNYWRKLGVTPETLKFYDVYEIDSFHYRNTDTNDTLTKITCNTLTFGFLFYKPGDDNKFKEKAGWKIYSPFHPNKKFKWIGNVTKNIIQGHKQLCMLQSMYSTAASQELKQVLVQKAVCGEGFDNLVHTSSLKDVLVWAELGIHAIATQSEVPRFPVLNDLVDLKCWYDSVFINYDGDPVGLLNAAQLLSNHSDIYREELLVIPEHEGKDISGLVSLFGFDEAEKRFGYLRKKFPADIFSKSPPKLKINEPLDYSQRGNFYN